MNTPFKVAIAGLGTVGCGIIKMVQAQQAELNQKTGRQIEIVAVSSKTKNRDRDVDISHYQWFDNSVDMISFCGADCIIETIGGHDGIALDVVRSALTQKKHVITANKALLAYHGKELAALAEQNKVSLNFEAAVAGGIPIVKALREGLAGNKINRVYGILNGTSNYILTKIEETGQDFSVILKQAQDLGYAEADPTLDIGGGDVAHKLALLTALAFGTSVDLESVYVEGIENITLEDILFAKELGYRIKLLGITQLDGDKVIQRVHPCMIPLANPISEVSGAFNAVVTDGDFVGQTMLIGRGAGQGPTASAIISDIVDIARGLWMAPFSVPSRNAKPVTFQPITERVGKYCLRLVLPDRAGIVAKVTTILAVHNISIEAMSQKKSSMQEVPEGMVPVVLITHKTKEADFVAALEELKLLKNEVQFAKMLRIVHL